VPVEKTPEERRAERRQGIRDAIHGDLHILYDKFKETEYTGLINSHQDVGGVVVEAGGYPVAVRGLALANAFITYLDKEHTRSPLALAWKALEVEYPDLHRIISEHLDGDLTDDQLGEMFHLYRETIGKRMDRGFDLIAGKLGAWKN
jgi:hypothetical protein